MKYLILTTIQSRQLKKLHSVDVENGNVIYNVVHDINGDPTIFSTTSTPIDDIEVYLTYEKPHKSITLTREETKTLHETRTINVERGERLYNVSLDENDKIVLKALPQTFDVIIVR